MNSLFLTLKNAIAPQEKALNNIDSRGGGWMGLIRESFAGAWQRNIEVHVDTVLAFHAIFACTTLISSDIAKMRIKLTEEMTDGTWKDIPYGAYKVLDKPNRFQNHIQFFENWMNSKLTRGNTYVLKERDKNGRVIRLYILAPNLVTPLISDSGEIYYQLEQDNLSDIEQMIIVPASEIIHDRFNCLFHPLVGLSPIYACGLAAAQGLKIQNNSFRFFENMSRPSGILTAPGAIRDEVAVRLKAAWDQNFSGDNIGKVAVLGDDLKYEALAMTAEEAELVEQMKLTAEIVCSTFHVPKYKVLGDAPTANNIEALEQQYYSQCLQVLMEAAELCLDEGLEIPEGKATEFDIDGLLRMDTATQVETYSKGVIGGIFSPNEARIKFNLPPVAGGNSPYLQQQNYSLQALAKRDALENPFSGSPTPSPTDAPTPAPSSYNQNLGKDHIIEKDFISEFIELLENANGA